MSRWLLPLSAAVLLGLSACGGAAADTGRAAPGQADPVSGGAPSTPAGGAPGVLAEPALGSGTAPLSSDAPVVAFLGDSITAGLHLPAAQAFPAAVGRLLANQGLPLRPVLAGVSGDTSAGGLSRVDWVLRSRPDIVVIELGGNDGLRGKPVDDIERNLAAIIDKLQAAGARPLLLGIQLPGNYGGEYRSAFQSMYERLAREKDVPLVPRFLQGVGTRPELMQPDGIHPTAAGHELLAETLAPALAKLLEDLRGP